jgi:hypothetical protein
LAGVETPLWIIKMKIIVFFVLHTLYYL